MVAPIKWESPFVSRGNVLSTELNSLVAAATSAAGAEIDNSVNLDTFGKLEVNITFASTPSAGEELVIYLITAPDGINYEDSNTDVLPAKAVAYIPIDNVTTAQRLSSPVIPLPPAKMKFLLKNGASQTFAGSGNTVKLYTNNLESQ